MFVIWNYYDINFLEKKGTSNYFFCELPNSAFKFFSGFCFEEESELLKGI